MAGRPLAWRALVIPSGGWKRARWDILRTETLYLVVFGIWTLGLIWPSGWAWHAEGRSEYYEMILGLYATLGVFLIIAVRNPRAHASLIWFTVWSSLVHAGIMAVQALQTPAEHAHLLDDIPALLIVALLLAIFTPRAPAAERAKVPAAHPA